MLRLTGVRDGDRGAVAMIVAMLFGFGVMLGLAALTIDVGNINADRRQLQNGADAVALAVAQQCATTGTCDTAATYLRDLANANAADGATSIRRVDGRSPAICGTLSDLPDCLPLSSPSMTNLQECPSEPVGVPYVRVYTETQNSADKKNILPYYFGAAITGISGADQQACASVGVESLGSSYNALPIVMAKCAYDTMLAMNPSQPFPLMPPSPQASQIAAEPFPMQSWDPTKSGTTAVAMDYSKYVMTVWSHVQNNTVVPAKCDASNSGLYLPGGFGWTKTIDNTHCATNFVSDTGLVPIDSGTATPKGCMSGGTSPKSFIGTTTYIPIMTGISGNNYIIDGLAGFYVAGYHSPAASPNKYNGYNSIPTFAVPEMTGPADGFWGWFTDEYVPSGSPGDTENPRGPKVLGYIG